MADEHPPTLLSMKEVAARLRVTTRTITRMIEQGILPAYRVGGVLRIDEAELSAYLRKNRIQREPC